MVADPGEHCCVDQLALQEAGVLGIDLDLESPGQGVQSNLEEVHMAESRGQGQIHPEAVDHSHDRIAEEDSEAGMEHRVCPEPAPLGDLVADLGDPDGSNSRLQDDQQRYTVTILWLYERDNVSIRRKATEISTWFCAFGTGL